MPTPNNIPVITSPFDGSYLVPVVAVALAPSVWIAVGVIAGFGVLLCGADALARWRAGGRIRQWALARDIRSVQPCLRGGFVSWGWSVWTFAEMRVYRGTDVDGSTVEVLASYSAPAFGLVLAVWCEVPGDPGSAAGRRSF